MRVYVSLPLTGPSAPAGRDVLRGADLALEQDDDPPEVVVLDSHDAHDRDARAAANAARAAADPEAIAYVGDFHSSQVLASQPVLAAAGLLQVAPVATYAGLGGATLVRLMPDDRAGARAIAAWLAGAGVTELLVVHDHDEGYGVPVGRFCADAARERGLTVRLRPLWDDAERLADDARGAQAVLYVGVAGSGAARLWADLHAVAPRAWLLGSEGVAHAWLAAALDPGAAARTRFFTANRAPLACYGYEAMALVLDALSPDRAAVTATARATRDRPSIIGRYSLDADGLTTSTGYGRLAVVDGRLAWDR